MKWKHNALRDIFKRHDLIYDAFQNYFDNIEFQAHTFDLTTGFFWKKMCQFHDFFLIFQVNSWLTWLEEAESDEEDEDEDED